MIFRLLLCTVALLASPCLAQITPGQGAPNEFLRLRFVMNYNRNGFAGLVTGATTNVVKFGATGVNQEFADIANPTGTRYSLVRPNITNAIPDDGVDVFQVYPLIYGAYKSAVGTYGYPVADTQMCPPSDRLCQYQVFDKNYVVFGYDPAYFTGANFILRDPFFTKWTTLGGVVRFGGANTVETAVNSSVSNAAATMQGFTSGALYNITSGIMSGRLYAVRSPIYQVFAANGGHAGSLGFPAGEELTLATGNIRQSFEGGAIEYDPVSMAAFLRPGVRLVKILGDVTSSIHLKAGDTYTATVQVTAVTGEYLTDRTVNWVSSNGSVISVVNGGYTATLKAVGAGVANVTAVVDGKASAPISFVVANSCCQVGEGAPDVNTAQYFKDAVTRNNLNLQLPTAAGVQRAGNGYYQDFSSATNPNVRYTIALPDRSATAWVLSGIILSRYLELGGFTGQLGYPTSDATAGGRQLFANGSALAGNPVRLVANPILAKWSTVGYETGALGSPTADSDTFFTFAATSGVSQAFAGGTVYAATSGLQSGHAYAVSGVVLAKYISLKGPGGTLGAPLGDEFKKDGRGVQEFEGGTVDYAPGDTDARVTPRPRKPAIDATPLVVPAGSFVHLRVSGFDDGSTVKVSVSGQADFTVLLPNGSYAWDSFIPLSAPSAVVALRAATTDGKVSVTGSYSVRSWAEAKVQLSIVSGNNQAGPPGAVFAQSMKVVARDGAGNAIPGIPVSFEPSPGAQIVSASVTTGSDGQAQAVVRSPAATGVVLVTARINGDVAVFQALVKGSPAPANYPRLMQVGDALIGDGSGTIANQGAMLAATASVIRYYQDRGDLNSPYGLSDPANLNQFLTSLCNPDVQGIPMCDGYLTPFSGSAERIVNLWRLSKFAGKNVDAVTGPADLASVRDAVAAGHPALLALALSIDGAPAGSHYVVAIGIDDDGTLLVHDPSPALGRTRLSDYLNGFSIDGRAYLASVSSSVVLTPRSAVSAGFLLTSGDAPISAASPQGSCGTPLEVWSVAAVAGQSLSQKPATFRAQFCDGQSQVYQVESASPDPYHMVLSDLGAGGRRIELAGGGQAAFKVVKSGSAWTAVPMDVSFSASTVVNAASFQPGAAPGGIVSIFGSGLARPSGTKTRVTIAGQPATLLAASAFQLNVQVPPTVAPGQQTVAIISPYGNLNTSVEIAPVAPGIFTLDGKQGAVVNQDGSLNSASRPLPRGQVLIIYCTGLGVVAQSEAYQIVKNPVTVSLSGRDLAPAYAGLAPGFVGLYQVNVPVPADIPPGLDRPLALRQNQVASNAVAVSLQ